MNENLKHCPFCKSNDVEVQTFWASVKLWLVQCYGCGCNTAVFRSKEEAIEAWNRRDGAENNEQRNQTY